jgi:hypothetical protein
MLSKPGHAAKGVVYATVGVLTLGSLFHWFGGARVAGTRGALEAIASQPFGNILLILMTLGLAGYVVWRFVQAIKDVEGKGVDAPGRMQRAGFSVSIPPGCRCRRQSAPIAVGGRGRSDRAAISV